MLMNVVLEHTIAPKTCTNTNGSFNCGCYNGYLLDIDGLLLVEIIEGLRSKVV